MIFATIAGWLVKLGLSQAEAVDLVAALQTVFPCRKARAGDQLVLERRDDGELTTVTIDEYTRLRRV